VYLLYHHVAIPFRRKLLKYLFVAHLCVVRKLGEVAAANAIQVQGMVLRPKTGERNRSS
jgi:hypothetical protein